MWAWLACRKKQGELILRIEDIDPRRSQPEYVSALAEDLEWLGLYWERGWGKDAPETCVQSLRSHFYKEAMQTLRQKDLAYPCFCTRKELKELANAPHCEDDSLIYPGTCRNLSTEERRKRLERGDHASVRIKCPDEACISFDDGVYGRKVYKAREWGGDFAIARSDGVVAYQLAVAVDDSTMGVSQVVRGRDLLLSTARQLFLLDCLGMPKPSEYMHVPLLLDETGERLAKRHKSLTLSSLRAKGVQAEEILGFLSYLGGMNPRKEALKAKDLISVFSPAVLGREERVVTNALLSEFFAV